jgi:hypothetical protein
MGEKEKRATLIFCQIETKTNSATEKIQII